MSKECKIIALIPARSGSKRLSDKNIRPLGGHPLIAYTIAAALQSRIFDTVFVSTDSERYAEIAKYYGAEVSFLRPVEISGNLSPDIEWVRDTLERLDGEGRNYKCFSILRPTSPFRQADTIRRAWQEFTSKKGVDSIRAVELCKQHPGKMWVILGKRMVPLLPLGSTGQPWHSSQYQSLPKVYVQNTSLEIAWTRIVFEEGTIAGNIVEPFLTQGYEGFDVNDSYDWELAEKLVQRGQAILPNISQKEPYQQGNQSN